MMKNPGSLRAISFGIAFIAVVALTAMNVYSLFELRTNSIEAAKEAQEDRIESFIEDIRHSAADPVNRQLLGIDIGRVEYTFWRWRSFPGNLNEILDEASENPLYRDIYFSPQDGNHCNDPEMAIYRFNQFRENIEEVSAVDDIVCGGISLARLNAQAQDNIRYNLLTFDTNKSMTITLVNGDRRSVFGHLTFVYDQDHLINDFLPEQLGEHYGSDDSSVSVWIVEASNRRNIIAKSNPTADYIFETTHIHRRIPDFMNNWLIDVQYIETPVLAASNATLYRNLFVLGTAVFALFGAMIFMYVTSKRERDLAQRQAGFLANITHEFKTPLAAMQAAGENILDGRVSSGPRLKTYGSHIYNETIRLRKMIDQLLDIARIDSGQSMVQAKPVKLSDTVRDYFDSHQTYVTSKGFKFKLNLDKKNEIPYILADPDHLETIVSNLVENAIKYSPDEKEVTIAVIKNDDHVEIQVSDRGMGIPKKHQKQIFDKFYRIEDSMTARTKGHGLGLSIVKNLTELNGGKIRVNSESGEGSTFIVSFPEIDTNVLDEYLKANSDNVVSDNVELDDYDNK